MADAMSSFPFSAAILAGGRATRFGGRDKSALVVGGITILERQIAALASVSDDLLLVGAARDARDARAIPDLVAGCGPLGGLQAALTAARHDRVFVVACDMPHVEAPLVRHLAALAGDADAVVPRTERGYHPLCAVYARGCLAAVTRHLAERRFRMADLLASLRVRVVETADLEAFGDPQRLLANVNTPAEYAGVEALQGHER